MSELAENNQDFNERLDILKGAAAVALQMPTSAERIQRFVTAIQAAGPLGLVGEPLDVNAEVALLRSEVSPKAHSDSLENVELIGDLMVPRSIKYVTYVDPETQDTVDDFAVSFLAPFFVGFDTRRSLGYQPSAADLPLAKINSFYPAGVV